MTGTVLSVTVVDQWSIVLDVGEYIIQIASRLQTALKKLCSRVQFVRFVTLNMTMLCMLTDSSTCSRNILYMWLRFSGTEVV